jgi:hypothetical protein
MKLDEGNTATAENSVSAVGVCVIWLLIFFIIYLGVLPESVMEHLGTL